MKCLENKIRFIIREEINNLFEGNFEFVNNDEKFIPTLPISKSSAVALSFFQKNGGGAVNENDGSGKEKAKELSNRIPQNYNQIKRLKSFFEKYLPNVTETRRKNNITSYQYGTEHEMGKDNVLLIWNLHGGNKCMDWVNGIITKKHGSNLKTKERLRKAGGAGNNKGMGVFKVKNDPTKTRIHR